MRRLLTLCGAAALGAAGLRAQPAPAAPAPSPLPLAAYSQFGASLAQSAHLSELGWTDDQFNAFLEGMRASFHGRAVPLDQFGVQLEEATGRQIQAVSAPKPAPAAPSPSPAASAAAPDPRKVEAYFKALTKHLGLQWSVKGLGYSVVMSNNGERARPGDTVVLSCQAYAADAITPFPQLSSDRVRVKMADLLPGLLEGVQMMTVGSHGVFVLPAKLSFGTGSWPDGVPVGSPIIFRLALLEVVPAAP